MDSNNQAPKPAQPIKDIAPPPNNLLGNPTQFANIPVHSTPDSERAAHSNPIAGSNLPQAKPSSSKPKADDLDKVLKDVNKDVKAAIQKPSTLPRPTLAIVIAILVAIVLMAAAFFAFRKPS